MILFYRIEWFRKAPLWKYYANYFPVKLVKTAELDPNKGNYLLGSHPHGIICVGATACFGSDGAGWSKNFKDLIPNFLTLRTFHLPPGFKEIGSSLGDIIIIVEGSTAITSLCYARSRTVWNGTCWPCEPTVLA